MEKRHWQKIGSEEIYDNRPFFWVTEDATLRPDGKKAQYGVVHTNGAVFIVAITKTGKIIFVQQERYPIGRETLELVAGSLPENGDPLEHAKIELREEVNASSDQIELLGSLISSPARQSSGLKVVLATGVDDSALSSHHQEGNEAINAVMAFDQSEIVRKIASGEIDDAATIACLNLYWAKYGFPKT